MTTGPPSCLALEIWGGVECTINRVADRWFDQIAKSGHDVRTSDLDRFAALGIRAIRYPILWERVAPSSLDHIDWQWADERLSGLRDLGVRPIVGLLHHGSGPFYTSLLDPEFPEKLARYAGLVARKYPWITDYTPVNEPLTTARFSGLYGYWYPHGRSDRDYVRALLNQLRGTVLAMRAIREIVPEARLIQTEDCGRTFGRAMMRPQIIHEAHRRWLTADLLTGRVDRRHPFHAFLTAAGMTADEVAFFLDADCPPDVLGLNYYVTSDRYLDHRLDRYPVDCHGSNGQMKYADVEAVRARPAGIAGHEAHLVDAWKRYHLPLAITEVHLGCTRDEQMRWLIESWEGAHRARARGVDVRAVTAWALLGSYDWDSLVTRDEGHYEPGTFDVRSPVPRATALCELVRSLATGESARHPAVAGEPWWRRSDRMVHTPRPIVSHRSADAPPVLIVGATGTLGRAFQRICELRGMSSRLVGRQEVDIADPAQVDAILRRLHPWAVINAAGYVRVDEAERDPEVCRRANVFGPVNLAAACRRRRVRLVTFSSDLVFDGHEQRPYVEDDEPRPLNVYGSSKALAERRVLDVLPDALVVRTSAFFGPWDDFNFLAALFRTLENGARFPAPADSIVSPTYVPDLAHATLDLLIDGEAAVWHLANDGAMTWFDFACAAARRRGHGIDQIDPVETSKAWGPAVRPRYSALSSKRGLVMRSLDEALDAYVQHTPNVCLATGTDECVSR
jgi:dTDP-4-dehydrorhamnose reductase